MSRIKIELPGNFYFQTTIPVRITDINYGGHLGNDSVLSIIHEARMRFLAGFGFAELDIAGVGLIMSDAGIEFKNEAFYGDIILASVTALQVSKLSFDLFYKLETETDGKRTIIAIAKTGMVCFDYSRKKIVPIPENAQIIFKENPE